MNKELPKRIKYRTNFKKIKEFLFRDFYPESSVVNSPFSRPESYLLNKNGDLFSFNDCLITQSGVEYRPLVHLEDLEDKGIRLKLDQKFEQFYNINLIGNEYKKKDSSGDWEVNCIPFHLALNTGFYLLLSLEIVILVLLTAQNHLIYTN